MNFTMPLSANSTRTLGPQEVPLVAEACQPVASAGTAYERGLVLEHDDARLARQFRRLVAAIVTELPPQLGGTILLAGAGSSSHVADVAGQVAKQMAADCHCDVLLADADADQRVLSQRFAAAADQGLVDALHDRSPANRLAASTALPRLSFLAFGQGLAWRRSPVQESVRELVAHCRQDYRYTLLAAGSELTPLTHYLARYCDATYLVVQLGHAERLHAARTAQELVASGARLLGSIVTGLRG